MNPVSAQLRSSLKKVILLAIMLFVVGMYSVAESASVEAKQPLRILYIGGDDDVLGGPGPQRAADFQQFLEKYFTSVATTKGTDFKGEMAKGIDVIVKDARIPIVLPPTFRKPMVLVGSNGLRGIDRTGTKIDLLCECLKEKLHTIQLDHPIFHGPLAVTPTLTQEVDPVTGKTFGMWKVHEKMESPGLVTAVDQFLDADDSEIIAGGINMKGDHGVALVREANLFLWGPIGNPRLMTEEARRVFVNTVVYMKQFDGAKQTVWRGLHGRRELEMVLATKDLRRMLGSERAYNDFLPTLIDKYSDSIEKYRAYYGPNLGYVHEPHGAIWFEVDEDAKSLGIANNDPRLLEKCVGLLSNPSEAPKALRLLQRYTGLSLTDTTAWQDWLKQNRSKLYFSDSYDYRFFTGPAGPAPTPGSVRTAIDAMSVTEPTDVAPVSVGATAATYFHSKEGNFSKKGALVTLVVRLKVADGWHVYAQVPQDVPYTPIKIDAQLPDGLRWNEGWQTPLATNGDVPGLMEYRGDTVFTRQFYSTAAIAKAKIKGNVQFQVCDVQQCMPAAKASFEVPVTINENN
jgi:cytochrome c biogenesis DsbD-like protein